MIKYHKSSSGKIIAELTDNKVKIAEVGDILDLIAEIGQHDCNAMIVNESSLNKDFFDLKTRFAGEILQKFSNYRMRLAIIGDFTDVKSKALRDFIRESNTRGTINFVATSEEAIARLNK